MAVPGTSALSAVFVADVALLAEALTTLFVPSALKVRTAFVKFPAVAPANCAV